MEGDFTDDGWAFNWWAGALRATMERYGLDPRIDVPVHGSVGPVEEKLARTAAQVEAAQAFCADHSERGAHVFGCPVQHSTQGPISR